MMQNLALLFIFSILISSLTAFISKLDLVPRENNLDFSSRSTNAHALNKRTEGCSTTLLKEKNDAEPEVKRGPEYYAGMISSPIKDVADEKQEVEDRDNLIPNLKLAGTGAALIIGFCAFAVLSSPPPPASYTSASQPSSQ
mmetsp:Transcript_4703/g.6461  ORF Transcript_4703/g.6461 Transcript_4703/m.6461 type:complete len:141 (-) Transcript_4703:168-590(-)